MINSVYISFRTVLRANFTLFSPRNQQRLVGVGYYTHQMHRWRHQKNP